ncbi:unnamed protein product [Vitrella brassicaformis CCMP3155]|uniref:Chloride channel protein n=5 Tax=Vitrella brassicaformis TaxID=1169539 RepID=A0A0G4GB42_VITBC|nr:unnamed protein product [Vitrella brassicaformis CCMP3155]|eukprot:CEM25871.1 unnamed protein product [Vitrella brassicaformis CCMP3155]
MSNAGGPRQSVVDVPESPVSGNREASVPSSSLLRPPRPSTPNSGVLYGPGTVGLPPRWDSRYSMGSIGSMASIGTTGGSSLSDLPGDRRKFFTKAAWLMICCLVAGLLCGVAVCALRLAIDKTSGAFWVLSLLPFSDKSSVRVDKWEHQQDWDSTGFWKSFPSHEVSGVYSIMIALPLIGGLFAGLVIDHACAKVGGAGLTRSKAAIAARTGIPLYECFWRFLVSVVYIASGNGLGIEGPSVHICASLASNTAWLFSKMGLVAPEVIISMVAVGSSAGIASFNTPLAGCVFIFEEIFKFWKSEAVGALLLATATATFILRLAHQLFQEQWYIEAQGHVFDDRARVEHFEQAGWMLAAAFPAGIACGLHGLLWRKTMFPLRGLFKKWEKKHKWWCGAAVRLSLIGAYAGAVNALFFSLIAPDQTMFGIGEPTLKLLTSEATSEATLDTGLGGSLGLLYYLLKLSVTILSFAANGPGGVFTPSMAYGAVLGRLVADVFLVFHGMPLDATAEKILGGSVEAGIFRYVCVVCGMGAAVASTFRLPLMATVLVLELSREWSLTTPIVIACFVAWAVASNLDRLWASLFDDLAEQDGVDYSGLQARLALNDVAIGLQGVVTDQPSIAPSQFSDMIQKIRAATAIRVPSRSRLPRASTTMMVSVSKPNPHNYPLRLTDPSEAAQATADESPADGAATPPRSVLQWGWELVQGTQPKHGEGSPADDGNVAVVIHTHGRASDSHSRETTAESIVQAEQPGGDEDRVVIEINDERREHQRLLSPQQSHGQAAALPPLPIPPVSMREASPPHPHSGSLTPPAPGVRDRQQRGFDCYFGHVIKRPSPIPHAEYHSHHRRKDLREREGGIRISPVPHARIPYDDQPPSPAVLSVVSSSDFYSDPSHHSLESSSSHYAHSYSHNLNRKAGSDDGRPGPAIVHRAAKGGGRQTRSLTRSQHGEELASLANALQLSPALIPSSQRRPLPPSAKVMLPSSVKREESGGSESRPPRPAKLTRSKTVSLAMVQRGYADERGDRTPRRPRQGRETSDPSVGAQGLLLPPSSLIGNADMKTSPSLRLLMEVSRLADKRRRRSHVTPSATAAGALCQMGQEGAAAAAQSAPSSMVEAPQKAQVDTQPPAPAEASHPIALVNLADLALEGIDVNDLLRHRDTLLKIKRKRRDSTSKPPVDKTRGARTSLEAIDQERVARKKRSDKAADFLRLQKERLQTFAARARGGSRTPSPVVSPSPSFVRPAQQSEGATRVPPPSPMITFEEWDGSPPMGAGEVGLVSIPVASEESPVLAAARSAVATMASSQEQRLGAMLVPPPSDEEDASPANKSAVGDIDGGRERRRADLLHGSPPMPFASPPLLAKKNTVEVLPSQDELPVIMLPGGVDYKPPPPPLPSALRRSSVPATARPYPSPTSVSSAALSGFQIERKRVTWKTAEGEVLRGGSGGGGGSPKEAKDDRETSPTATASTGPSPGGAKPAPPHTVVSKSQKGLANIIEDETVRMSSSEFRSGLHLSFTKAVLEEKRRKQAEERRRRGGPLWRSWKFKTIREERADSPVFEGDKELRFERGGRQQQQQQPQKQKPMGFRSEQQGR